MRRWCIEPGTWYYKRQKPSTVSRFGCSGHSSSVQFKNVRDCYALINFVPRFMYSFDWWHCLLTQQLEMICQLLQQLHSLFDKDTGAAMLRKTALYIYIYIYFFFYRLKCPKWQKSPYRHFTKKNIEIKEKKKKINESWMIFKDSKGRWRDDVLWKIVPYTWRSNRI